MGNRIYHYPSYEARAWRAMTKKIDGVEDALTLDTIETMAWLVIEAAIEEPTATNDAWLEAAYSVTRDDDFASVDKNYIGWITDKVVSRARGYTTEGTVGSREQYEISLLGEI
ncbi:MAG: hypothetical protein WDN27_06630 [Candidatus Saccharibacteria bacterium]